MCREDNLARSVLGGVAQNISDDQRLYSRTLMSSWDQSAYSLKFGTTTIGGWAKQLITVCTVRLQCQNMVDLYSQALSPS